MMELLTLCEELLALAEAQRTAAAERRLDVVAELQERRQGIIERIQSFDGWGSADDSRDGKHDPRGEEFSLKAKAAIKKTLSVDEELRGIIQKELDALVSNMETVHKLKRAFCSSTASRQAGRKVNLSV